jgi:hypothetical protein
LSGTKTGFITTVFEELAKDPDIGVAILTGAGRAFCAGLDLKELASGQGMVGEIANERKAETNLTTPMKKFGRPVIGAINGVAITGGFELALGCDILIASTEARFADTHALAHDILSCPREMVVAYKKLIDDGFNMTYKDAFDLDRRVNYEYFQRVKPEDIAKRREGIQNRGRTQQK